MSNCEIPINHDSKNDPEVLQQEINCRLDNLEKNILDNLAPNVYEITENGNFNVILVGKKLDIDIKTPEQLVEVLKITYKLIGVFQSEGYTTSSEYFYAEEASESAGFNDRNAIIDIRVDNWTNTTMLTEEAFIKIFKQNPRRGGKIVPKYINFLNSIADHNIWNTPIIKAIDSKSMTPTISNAIISNEHNDINPHNFLIQEEYVVSAGDTISSLFDKLTQENAEVLNSYIIKASDSSINRNKSILSDIKPGQAVNFTIYPDKMMVGINGTYHALDFQK